MYCIHLLIFARNNNIANRPGRYYNFSARYIGIEKYRNITIYRSFYKTYGFTVLLGCFDLFIDLVLQVPDFCLQ